jgi:hypothetical protein
LENAESIQQAGDLEAESQLQKIFIIFGFYFVKYPKLLNFSPP